MPDEREIPREIFDREVEWPKPRTDEGEEAAHPEVIPDTPEGPFKDWIKEKVEERKED